MPGHHLILGTLTDAVTGEALDDTLDERYRQKIARMLLGRCGFPAELIEPRRELMLEADGRRAVIKIDFIVKAGGRAAMVIRFGPGSIVSRERPALAISRLIAPYQVPVVVVTNGEDAEVLDGGSGRIIGRGLEAVPTRAALEAMTDGRPPAPVPADRARMEMRIAYCYEVDGACPCDDTICRL